MSAHMGSNSPNFKTDRGLAFEEFYLYFDRLYLMRNIQNLAVKTASGALPFLSRHAYDRQHEKDARPEARQITLPPSLEMSYLIQSF